MFYIAECNLISVLNNLDITISLFRYFISISMVLLWQGPEHALHVTTISFMQIAQSILFNSTIAEA